VINCVFHSKRLERESAMPPFSHNSVIVTTDFLDGNIVQRKPEVHNIPHREQVMLVSSLALIR
jgi:hypothetical protein